MKKYFNEKHDAIIESRFVAKVPNPKEGEVIPHKPIVSNVTFFQMSEDMKWSKIWISKEMILDIASQIKEIESQTIDMCYDPGLPF